MILGPDKTRLSKRHGAESVLAYREMGYLPQGLMNYLVRLGWSYGDQEVFTIQEMIDKFALDSVGTSAGMFDPEKLRSINGDHMKASRTEDILALLIPHIKTKGYALEKGERLTRIVESLKERAKTLVDMADQAEFYFRDTIDYEEKAAAKFLTPDSLPVLENLIEQVQEMDVLDQAGLESVFRQLAERMEVKLGRVAQPVRVALTGGTASPGLFEVMSILGRETVLRRLHSAVEYIRGKGSVDN
jgi:glutamyl-tRNA synthetase